MTTAKTSTSAISKRDARDADPIPTAKEQKVLKEEALRKQFALRKPATPLEPSELGRIARTPLKYSIHCKLSAELWTILDTLCKDSGESPSVVIRGLIRNGGEMRTLRKIVTDVTKQ